jgi:hypothetical protein
MRRAKPGDGRSWATRDVRPEDLPDLHQAPPRATITWVGTDSAVRLAPATARFDGSAWHLDALPARAGPREVVLVVDDGMGWFELRSITVRGTVSPDQDGSVHARRVVTWDYGTLRLIDAGDAPLRTPPPTSGTSSDSATPPVLALPPDARRIVRRARVLLLATASARGHPFCVPIWFAEHRGRFWMSTGAASWSARNATADARVQLLFGGAGRPFEPRVRITGHAECRRGGLPPPSVIARLAVRYYLAPRRALVEVRHWRQWRIRMRYYSQTEGGAAYLVVTPTRVEVLAAP